MIFVCNSTAIIGLARVGKLNILKEVVGQVYIPDAVYKEVVVEGKGRPGSKEVEKANWIKKVSIKDTFAVQILRKDLGPGESEAIVLAQELGADYIILDEEARDYAKRLGLEVIGTVGILLWAKKLGKISNLKLVIDELIQSGFRIRDKIYRKVITEEL